MALLTARTLDRWCRGVVRPPRLVIAGSFTGLVTVGVVVALACLIGGGVLVPSLVRHKAIPGLAASAWLGVLPIAVAVVAGWLVRRDRRVPALATVAAGAVAFVGAAPWVAVGTVERHKAPRELIAAAGACRPYDEVRVGCYGWFQPSLVFYARREVAEFHAERDALDFLRGPLPSYLLMPAKAWESLAPRAVGCRELARRRDLYRGFDVVVVGNALSGRET